MNHKSQKQSGSTSPFIREIKAETSVQSPLRMWKQMNEENWQRIKRDGYIPIPLKSTKSANMNRIQVSQLSNIRPVLNHEQLTLHARQTQAYNTENTNSLTLSKTIKLNEHLKKRKRGNTNTNRFLTGNHSSIAAMK